ncbi:MAG: Spy/CpxP family protein refolding chaperone [Oculatellaceae cyanobacterium bins.114]|nr:Spy/CpxP family protein refolding chaperone [Oculatellaceae cyanobacterium bins.114]
MKFVTIKPMTVLTGGAMAVVGLAAGLTIAFHPVVVQAQARDGMEQWSQVLEELNLTPEQQTQLNQIRQNTRSELEALLTEDQRAQFRSTLESGNGFREAIAAMNLSSEQQTQLRAIFQSAREQAATVLTDEQRQQVQELVRSRLQQR